MSTAIRSSITSLAITAFHEHSEKAEQQGEEMFDVHRDEFIACARATAVGALGDTIADQLDWVYTGTADLPPDTEEARALLDGGPDYLRYRYSDESCSFELVQPCGLCGHIRINEVSNLIHLGHLLDEARQNPAKAGGSDGR